MAWAVSGRWSSRTVTMLVTANITVMARLAEGLVPSRNAGGSNAHQDEAPPRRLASRCEVTMPVVRWARLTPYVGRYFEDGRTLFP
ncbi:hypothetical protein F5Y02DRAFT_1938 [Annulohypoxylon stygium]|nr:hypothetical protein F5Y02DRAFT_1938 [Annulohypoxylon stygium]